MLSKGSFHLRQMTKPFGAVNGKARSYYALFCFFDRLAIVKLTKSMSSRPFSRRLCGVDGIDSVE